MTENSKTHSDEEQKHEKHGKFDSIRRAGVRLIYSKHMLWGIGIASFLEAIIVPIPLETILIPLMQARRKQIFIISSVALAGCVIAAAVGYAIGYFVFDAIGTRIISLVSTPEQFAEVSQKMQEKGFWFVFSVGVIPIPFQIAMLAAGATKYSFWLFLIATTCSRAIRYYGLAILVLFTGNQAERLFKKHKLSTSIILLFIVAAIWTYSIFG